MSALAAVSDIADVQHRRLAEGDSPEALTEIYEDDVNIAVWRRGLAPALTAAAANIVQQHPSLQAVLPVTLDSVESDLQGMLRQGNATNEHSEALIKDGAELLDMFFCLFDLQLAGLRLTTLSRAMCPKFHVDRVPCRLVTTYGGRGTEWLPHDSVVRPRPGSVEPLEPNEQSPHYAERNQIQTLQAGDVALLKGELWPNNENAGLVHRSPTLVNGEQRLLLTLDFIDAS